MPELRSLDISLRSYEMRDEIRLDKVLMTCPKLQYLSVDKNMIGRVGFAGGDQLPLTVFEDASESWSSEEGWKAQGGTQSGDGVDGTEEEEEESDDELEDEMYAGTEWHRRFAKEIVDPRYMDQILDSDSSTSTNTTSNDGDAKANPGVRSGKSDPPAQGLTKVSYRRLLKQQRQQRRQRPLALKTLKLKKLRMSEQDFLSLVRRCPLLEEMDVYTTTAWSWSPSFLESVSKSCPKIRHLHLATNHTAPEVEENGAATQHGIVILNNNNVETAAPANAVQEPLLGSPDNPGHSPSLHPLLASDVTQQDVSQAVTAIGSLADAMRAVLRFRRQLLQELYDPIVGLIKLYPDLISYEARFVKFQDPTLKVLQQHCRFLERLDLTDCKEVSPNALDEFLRWAPTLRHLSANLVMFRMERLIQVSELHQRRDSLLAKRALASKEREIFGGSGADSGLEDWLEGDQEYEEKDEEMEMEELVPRWWACQWLETLILGVQNPCLNPNKERKFYQPVEVTAESLFYNRDLQGSSSGSGNGAYAGTGSYAPLSLSSIGTSHVSRGGMTSEQEHIQHCTFAFFEQMGRLIRLRRLELTGGQFDLGVGSLPLSSTSSSLPPPVQLQPSSSSSSSSSSPSPYRSNGNESRSRHGDGQTLDNGSHHLRTHTEQGHLGMEKRPDLSKSKSLPESTTSSWRGGLNRVRSFINLKPRKPEALKQGGGNLVVEGIERQRSSSELRLAPPVGGPSDEDGKDKDRAKGKDKGKGKAKGEGKSRFFGRDKGKQPAVQRSGLDASAATAASAASATPPPLLPPIAPSLPPPPPQPPLSGAVKNGKMPVREILDGSSDNCNHHDQYRPPHRDPTLAGLRPLANLTQLEHFSMTWANFPRLHEPDIEWICTQWPALTWITLGLIHVDEWSLIRHWVHRRRRDIIVVFEK